jgi:serine protease Do
MGASIRYLLAVLAGLSLPAAGLCASPAPFLHGSSQTAQPVETVAEEPADRADRMGLVLRPLSKAERRSLGLSAGGLRVARVTEGAARKAGFLVGDVVLMLDGVSVTDPAQFQRLEQQLPHDRPVPVLVQRPGATLFLPLHADY